MHFCVVAVYAGQVQRKAYPSDVSDEEWAVVMPNLALITEDAPPTRAPLARNV